MHAVIYAQHFHLVFQDYPKFKVVAHLFTLRPGLYWMKPGCPGQMVGVLFKPECLGEVGVLLSRDVQDKWWGYYLSRNV